MAMIELHKVTKSFGAVEVIKQVDLAVGEGEFVAFVGQSGSGKSTLLRMIAGLENVTDGAILIDGKDVTFAEPSERGVAMVFQSYALYPHMNVRDNIAFNLKLSKHSKDEIESRVLEAARVLRLMDLLDRSPAQLSGGQRQRVAIGRAIVRKPKVFLFDEPLSNLDAALRVQMRLEIKRLHRELSATMVYVTHDQIEAMTLADRIVALEDGRIQQVGAPLDLYHHPSNLFVAGFVGSPQMNFLPAESAGSSSITLKLGNGLGFESTNPVPDKGSAMTVGIRPEMLNIGAGARAGAITINGTVQAVERLGNLTYVHADIGAEDPVAIQIMGDTDIRSGQSTQIWFERTNAHLFDDEGKAIVENSLI